MSFYINYEDDVIIDLTPEEILEDQRLENQYFNSNNQDQNESNNNISTNEPPQNTNNLFFDITMYNFSVEQQNSQNNRTQHTTPVANTSSQKKKSLLEDSFTPPKLQKKVSSAWSNLNLSINSDTNSTEDNNKPYFNDGGHINPKFRSTHVPYAQKRALKTQKIEKEREQMIMEIENENITSGSISPYSGDMEIFYQEKIRRPLDGIHVDINEKIEIDW